MRNYYILISFMVVLLSPPVIKASYELPADTSDTAAVEEPALPVLPRFQTSLKCRLSRRA
jgi:hypothetical protein